MNKIKEFRTKRNLTQSELSKKVGISRTYLSDIETFKRCPGIIIALRISKALGVPVEQLFFDQSIMHAERVGA